MTPRMIVVLGFALAAATSPAAAQDPVEGGALFYTFCSSCHGDDAKGDGPMTEILNDAPPDLTGLVARNGGEFPTENVVFRIDGRDPLDAHGGPMPIFGDIFGEDLVAMKTASGQPILAGRAIGDLIAWLEMVQE